MIFDDSEPPVPYESLSVHSDDEITKEFEIMIYEKKEKCECCNSNTDKIFLYRNHFYLCIKCCYTYDDKFKCTQCKNIVLANLWYQNINNLQICFYCYEQQQLNKCTKCNISKNITFWYKGENGQIYPKCYNVNNTGKVCDQCNITKFVKNGIL